MTDQQKPRRAFSLVLILEADTRDEIASALVNFAAQVERDQITRGVSGSPSSGTIYELVCDPSQTHERYFEQVREYLAGEGSRP